MCEKDGGLKSVVCRGELCEFFSYRKFSLGEDSLNSKHVVLKFSNEIPHPCHLFASTTKPYVCEKLGARELENGSDFPTTTPKKRKKK